MKQTLISLRHRLRSVKIDALACRAGLWPSCPKGSIPGVRVVITDEGSHLWRVAHTAFYADCFAIHERICNFFACSFDNVTESLTGCAASAPPPVSKKSGDELFSAYKSNDTVEKSAPWAKMAADIPPLHYSPDNSRQHDNRHGEAEQRIFPAKSNNNNNYGPEGKLNYFAPESEFFGCADILIIIYKPFFSNQ